MSDDARALLDAVVGSLESGDPSDVAPIIAPGAVVWHNDDGVDMPAAEAFARVPHLHALVEGLRVEVISHDATRDGLVARIELRGTVRATGASLRARHCVFLAVEDGRLARLDEYIDPTFSTQLGL